MNPRLFLTVCLNPVLQKTVVLKKLIHGEVNRVEALYEDASGKGVNVIRVLGQLGCKAELITQAGGWNAARFLALAKQHVLCLHTAPAPLAIRFCYTLIHTATGQTTEIVEEADPVTRLTQARVKNLFLRRITHAHTLVISGTKATGFSDSLYPWMVRTARRWKVRVILDIKGKDLVRCLEYGPQVIKPNFAEFVSTFVPGVAASESSENARLLHRVEKTMVSLNKKYGCAVVLTRVRFPVLFADGGRIGSVGVKQIRAVNSTGSGDAFTAGLASQLSCAAPLVTAIREGMRCAALNALNVRPGNILH
ncbi:MAG: hypothetical protein A2487_19170 [Candidatus Raymondbacteria bacterium RifOxyC12_full_50_8]|nr:MAG: hypothetical protein A2487_19170 [Candidatus Raymondbacteria bacterium RifOxyC12_full_50_8]